MNKLTIMTAFFLIMGCSQSVISNVYDRFYARLDTVKHRDKISDIDFNGDGSLIATAGYDRIIKIWDVNAENLLTELPRSRWLIENIFWNTNNLFVVHYDCLSANCVTLKIFDRNFNKTVFELKKEKDKSILRMEFSKDGSKLIIVHGIPFQHLLFGGSLDQHQVIDVWDLQTREKIFTFKEDHIEDFSLNENKDTLFVFYCCQIEKIKAYRFSSGILKFSLKNKNIEEGYSSGHISYSHDDSRFVVNMSESDSSGFVIIGDTDTGNVKEIPVDNRITEMGFNSMGNIVMFSSVDRTISILDSKTLTNIDKYSVNAENVSFDANYEYAIPFGTNILQIDVISVLSGLKIFSSTENGSKGSMIIPSFFGENGSVLIYNVVNFSGVVSFESPSKIFDIKTGSLVLSMPDKSSRLSVRTNMDLSRVASFDQNGRATVWDAKTGAKLFTVRHREK